MLLILGRNAQQEVGKMLLHRSQSFREYKSFDSHLLPPESLS
ncbi:unnamed protein product [Gulo gulo]|uniref:Uncharacterized protein n=1 Tax=Gulo gulo TaxID=48420 RepID=A0A9X9LSB1_GULGU|nr:unnamed protein product [Gulo gulo]